MDITSRLDFAATPQSVEEMLLTREFLNEVCVRGGATSHEVTVTGRRTVSRRSLPAPDMAKAFTGSTISIIEDITWGEARADGSLTGDLVLTVEGQPAKMIGTVVLAPAGTGTSVTISGDLKVSIPLLGKKLEKAAAPAIHEGIRVQQEVGDHWLADR